MQAFSHPRQRSRPDAWKRGMVIPRRDIYTLSRDSEAQPEGKHAENLSSVMQALSSMQLVELQGG
jgi:hypothetical protein